MSNHLANQQETVPVSTCMLMVKYIMPNLHAEFLADIKDYSVK